MSITIVLKSDTLSGASFVDSFITETIACKLVVVDGLSYQIKIDAVCFVALGTISYEFSVIQYVPTRDTVTFKAASLKGVLPMYNNAEDMIRSKQVKF